jgi:hypothetical protein
MITRTTSAPCSDCTEALQRGSGHARLTAIGNAVLIPGASQTEYRFSQCEVCGHIWQVIEDSGRGGHGITRSIITKNW